MRRSFAFGVTDLGEGITGMHLMVGFVRDIGIMPGPVKRSLYKFLII